MRSNWLSSTLALIVPAAALITACGPAETGTGGTGGTGGSTGGSTVSVGGSTGGSTVSTGGSTGGSTVSTGGSTGGTGGTGGSGPPVNDACPGSEVAIAIDTSTSIQGSLVNATDDYTTFCADPGADDKPDVVYQLVVPAAATVSVTVTGDGFDPALSLRKFECDTRFATDACYNLGTGSASTTVALDAGTYWLVVDTEDGNVGSFSLDVSITTPACGDGAVNPGEQCDPVTVSNNDGCYNPATANECQFGEPPQDTAVIECPGGVIAVPKGMVQQYGPYNNGSGKSQSINTLDDPMGDFTGPCPYAAHGPENIFHIIPNADGVLKATIGHDVDGVTPYCSDPGHVCGDFVIYLRSDACDAGDQIMCDDYNEDPNNFEVLSVQTAVTAGTSYWLYVDSYQDDPMDPLTAYPGEYFLELFLQ